eukprot:GEMP01088770.1.p1 GENE.GEMP01088770.1~~GEMP01088770.1.p1  ORF type:complete len:211 (+),score=35.91 GEMP01088770.1:48-680(+)
MHFSYALFSIHISMLCWTPIVVKANIPPKRVDDELADQPFQFFGGGIDDEDPGDEDSDDFDASGDENDLSSSDDEGVFYPGDDNMLGSPPLQRVFPLRMRDLEIRVFGFGSCVSVGDDVDDLPASDGEGVFHGDDNGIEDGDHLRVPQYVDDIYTQSGGLRVRMPLVTNIGDAAYSWVMDEREQQRAFIWLNIYIFLQLPSLSWLIKMLR